MKAIKKLDGKLPKFDVAKEFVSIEYQIFSRYQVERVLAFLLIPAEELEAQPEGAGRSWSFLHDIVSGETK